jgi:hypothetical protein
VSNSSPGRGRIFLLSKSSRPVFAPTKPLSLRLHDVVFN